MADTALPASRLQFAGRQTPSDQISMYLFNVELATWELRDDGTRALVIPSVDFTPVAANPGGATTLWANSGAANALYYGGTPVGGGGGGVTEPTNAKVVNVRDYGAVGDGTTDDTEAFKTALEAIDEHLVPGADPGSLLHDYYAAPAIFRMPAGQYRITEAQVFLKLAPHRAGGLIVEGGGMLTTTIVYDPPTGLGIQYLCDHTSDLDDDDSTTINNNVLGWGWTTWRDFAVLGMHDECGFWKSWSSGGVQHHTFERVLWERVHTIFRMVGLDTNSEFKLNNCTGIGHCKYLFYLGSDATDQMLNYWIHDLVWHTDEGVIAHVEKGGGLHFIGGSFIHVWPNTYPATGYPVPTDPVYYFELLGPSHASGTAVLEVKGARIEHRQLLSNTLLCEWGHGQISFDCVADDIHSWVAVLDPEAESYYEPTEQENYRFDINNLATLHVSFTNCSFQGFMTWKYGIAAHNDRVRTLFDNCSFANFADPADCVHFERYQYEPDVDHINVGGAPLLEFRSCKGIGPESTGEDNPYLWDHIRNGHNHRMGQLPVRSLFLCASDSTMPIAEDPRDLIQAIMPPYAFIQQVRLFAEPGEYTSFVPDPGEELRVEIAPGTISAKTFSGGETRVTFSQAVQAGDEVCIFSTVDDTWKHYLAQASGTAAIAIRPAATNVAGDYTAEVNNGDDYGISIGYYRAVDFANGFDVVVPLGRRLGLTPASRTIRLVGDNTEQRQTAQVTVEYRA